MSDIEKILNHMFRSKYTFFRPSTIAYQTQLEENRIRNLIKNMEEHGVVKKLPGRNLKNLYFLTPATRWILRGLLGWQY